MKQTTERIRRSLTGVLAALLLVTFASHGGGEESANYSMDFSRQQFGASVGDSDNYDVQDSIAYAEPEHIAQQSPTYEVSNTLGVILQANNGLGSGFGTTARLSWHPIGVPGFAGYNIYRSNSLGGPYDRVNDEMVEGTTYEDQNLQNGTYYYLIFVVSDGEPPEEYLYTSITVEITGVQTAVWVDFAWQGEQTGQPGTPYRTLATGLAWVAAGGEVTILPGESGETMRIDKPVRLKSTAVPGEPARIGYIHP
jgi:hypothetical protein